MPVANVSWNEAKAFCENFGYALPTEAEWEYAARGGSSTLWSFGDDEEQLNNYAWLDAQAHPVGGRAPNPLGLYDMHGNVFEWVEDCYDENAYKSRSLFITNPTAPPGITGSCQYRLPRGGSFDIGGGNLRSADRGRYRPGFRGPGDGFRCVRRPRRQP